MTRHSDRARFCTTYLVLALAAGCTVDDEEGVAVFDDDDRDVQLDEIDSITELGEDGEVVRVSSVTSDLALAVPAYATITAGGRTIELPLGLRTAGIDLPAGDPLDPALIELGNLLFFDRRLSSTGAMSCATCHVPARGYAAIAFNVGVGGNRLARTTPPATNRLYGTENNWLGQNTLEQQSTKPIVSALEMGLTSSTLLAAVRAVPGYVERFDRLAAAGQLAAPAISVANIGKAIATFQRTLFAGASRVDRYEAGDLGALTTQEIAGRTLFHGRARCALCHNGPNYANEQFHNIVSGCPNSTDTCVHPTTTFEAGRYLVSGSQADIGRFKTPSLRNVGLRGPYFHNGIDVTLDKVVHGYNVGADLDTQIGQDPLLINLGLNTAEKAQLVAFMKALTGTVVVSATLSRAGLPSSTPWRERALLSPDVFDVAFYRSRNPDIAGIDSMTDDQVRSHWVRIGAAEGRRATLAFYPREYDRFLTVVDATYSPASTSGTYLPAVQRYLDRDRRIGRQYSGRYVLWSGFFAYREYRRLNSSRLAFATPAAVVHDFLTFGLANHLDGREQYPAGVAFLVGGVTYRIASANTYCRLTIGSTSKLPIWPYIPPRLRSIGACAG